MEHTNLKLLQDPPATNTPHPWLIHVWGKTSDVAQSPDYILYSFYANSVCLKSQIFPLHMDIEILFLLGFQLFLVILFTSA